MSTPGGIRNLHFHLLSSPPLFWTHGIHLFFVHHATSTFLDDDRDDVAPSFFPSLVLEVKSWFCSPYGSSTGNYLVDFLFFHHKRHSDDVRILARPVLESSNPFHHLVDFFLFCGWVQVFVTRMFFHFAGEKTYPIPVPRDRPLLYQFLSSYLVTVPCGSMPLVP